jgi:ABC-type oligopeptide transport system substrate-binding subunit
MKTRKRKLLLFVLILLTTSLSPAAAQRVRSINQTEVKIYLVRESDEYDERNPHNLVAVKRRANAEFPLRSALIALTGKVTRAEEQAKLFSPMFGIKLLSVRLKNGTAYTYFTMPEGDHFSGDGSPFIFEDAVKRTAMQFPMVKKVVVCLDGVLNFWSESEEPARKCP